jgi:hypothetical protein
VDDWQIKKSLGQCFGSGAVIEPGQEYYATLVETEAGLERRDYSEAYWKEHKPEVFCFWKSRLASPEQKKKLFVDDDMLMAFFERLESETDPEKIKFRFVLTLILMRKRLLKYDSSCTKDGAEVWCLKVTGAAERGLVEVINPHLAEEQIEELSGQVGQILQVAEL